MKNTLCNPAKLMVAIAILLGACNGGVDKDPESQELKTGIITDASTMDGPWVQEHHIIVDGSLKEIWDYYSSAEAMESHVAPIMEVEFKNGGRWEASYDLSAKIGDSANFVNEIVNIIPYRQFTTRAVSAPFNLEAMQSLRSTMIFEDLGDSKVRVRAVTTGWEGISDADYRRKVFESAGRTNPEILKCLDVRINNGPLDWRKILQQE